METVTDFIFLSSKITADVDGSQEIKRRLLLKRKGIAMEDADMPKELENPDLVNRSTLVPQK